MDKMKILITGGDGYIARSMKVALQEYHNITSIGRDDFDLTDSEKTKSFFKRKQFDVVLHCAVKGGSRLIPETWKDMDDNLKMYYNLLENKDHYHKFIHFGSGAELHSADTPYGLSKVVIAKSIYDIENFYNIRIFGVFDENELDTRFIKANVKRYINKEPMLIQNKKMSFFYMKDLIMLVKYHIDNPSCKLLKESNCSYIGSYSLLDIANMINNLNDHKVPIYMDTVQSKDYESRLNAPYDIKYIGLQRGIIDVYEKLKNNE